MKSINKAYVNKKGKKEKQTETGRREVPQLTISEQLDLLANILIEIFRTNENERAEAKE